MEVKVDALDNLKQLAKPIGMEIATKPDLSKTVEFIPIGEWLNRVEQTRLSQTPVADVARVDASLGYIQELKAKSSEAKANNTTISTEDVGKYSNYHKSLVEKGIESSTDLVGDLTAIPNAAESDQLAASMTKARVLNEVHRIMQVPDNTTKKCPTFDEAVGVIEAKINTSRQKIVENAINDSARISRNPDIFYQGDATTIDEWFKETTAFSDQTKRSLGQLEMLRFTNYYSQIGNTAERASAVTKAVEDLAKPETKQVYGRQEKMQAVIDYAENSGVLNKDQIGNILKKYPHIRTEDRQSNSETIANAPSVVVQTEDGRLEENKPGMCQKEDVEKLEQKVVDKEHVHWDKRAVLLPDTHGANQQAIEASIREAYGVDINVDFHDRKAFVDGEEVIIYQSGDIIDANKELMRWYEMSAGQLQSQAEYEEALANERHPKHIRAVNRENYLKDPKNLSEFQENWKRLENTRVNESVDYWSDAIKEGRMILGNHEAMLMAGFVGDNEQLLIWLSDTNQGSSTLSTLTGLSRERDLGIVGLDEVVISGYSPEKKTEICNKVREALKNSPQSKELLTNLFDHAKLYNIVNGDLVIHACVPIDKDTGKLISPESSNSLKNEYLRVPSRQQYSTEESYQFVVQSQKLASEFYSNVESLTGLEALDYIEQQIRARNPYAVLFIANGRAEKMSPLWGRTNFQEAMQAHGDTAILELSRQAEKKGVQGGIKKVIVGHTPTIGGTSIGNNLLGADNDKHSAVRLELTKDSSGRINNEIRAVHNFGSSNLISDQIT